jgi:hypothetical protein
MLELIDCDFVHPKKEATMYGAVVAAFVAAHPAQAQTMIAAHIKAGHGGLSTNEAIKMPLDDPMVAAAVTFAATAEATPDDFDNLGKLLMVGFAGFSTIPGTEGGGEYLFGMDQFGGIVACIGAELNATHTELMNTVPLTVIGHAIAQKSKQGGTKGIARPKDKRHMADLFEMADNLIADGKLLPWQESEPIHFGLLGHENADEAYRLAVLQHEERVKKGIA